MPHHTEYVLTAIGVNPMHFRNRLRAWIAWAILSTNYRIANFAFNNVVPRWHQSRPYAESRKESWNTVLDSIRAS